jgi:hypothetical protein
MNLSRSDFILGVFCKYRAAAAIAKITKQRNDIGRPDKEVGKARKTRAAEPMPARQLCLISDAKL